MSTKVARTLQPMANIADAIKGWTMVSLTFTFILLYGAALVGWLKPLADEKMVLRLEPLIFAVIGYYFGRLPGQQNEKTLKEEISRQTQRADAAQHAKERALQAREMLEEKLKNVEAALGPSASTIVAAEVNDNAQSTKAEATRHDINAALRIINS